MELEVKRKLPKVDVRALVNAGDRVQFLSLPPSPDTVSSHNLGTPRDPLPVLLAGTKALHHTSRITRHSCSPAPQHTLLEFIEL